jgi:threonine dehydratase
MKLTLTELRQAASVVHAAMDPTPQRRWPLLDERTGAEVWVKHENHAPTGAFKVRGGLVHADALTRLPDPPQGVIAATRGNHGQSVAFACARAGLSASIVVPRGNSPEKNAAMRALGAELIEYGEDFSSSLDHARALADERGLRFFPSFHRDLVAGVASYALELFDAVTDLDTVYVPIGLGSGICAVMAARDALGLSTRVVGVVAERAPAYALSFEKGEPVASERADTFADGVAVRVPNAPAVELICRGADRIVTLAEDEFAEASRCYFSDTHNVAEGAGAAGLAALLQERERMRGHRVALVITGGNIDRDLYRRILAGETPDPYLTRST